MILLDKHSTDEKIVKTNALTTIFLLLLISVGYFSTDIYLPSLTKLLEYFETTERQTQMTMFSYLISFSFTAVQNQRSITVMEKIGMHHNPSDDFDHSNLPEGHRLRRHMLYRINQLDWKKVHDRKT